MKRLYLAIFTVSMFLVIPAFAIAGEYAPDTKSAPSVGQQVIREGDYAVELVQALKIGPQQGEADAETALAARGITPKSGWISDFPVTPDIIADVQASIDAAADAGKLPIGKADAEQAFVALNTEIGIAVTPAAEPGPEGNYAGDEAYTEPTVIENYYTDEGPPVVTYYAPPPDYAYLYAWDPFPFWCGGFWFPGYYVLNDFDFAFFGYGHFGFYGRSDFGFYRHHHEFWHGDRQLSNHVIDPVTKRAVAIDPISRHPFNRTAFRPIGARSFDPVARTAGHGQRFIGNAGVRNGSSQFSRSFNRASAANIVNRSTGRLGTATFGRSVGTPSGFQRGAISGGTQYRGYNRPSGSYSRPSGSYSRSFSAPGRSYSAPNRSYGAPGRSYSAPSRSYSGGGGRSFSGGGGRSFGGGGRSFGGGGGRR
ncbi:MAG: hypothetical protein WA666_03235 [Nitrospirota bacterium]